jgi:hypothetical protein
VTNALDVAQRFETVLELPPLSGIEVVAKPEVNGVDEHR